jgi:PAS domain S-box-containing protein
MTLAAETLDSASTTADSVDHLLALLQPVAPVARSADDAQAGQLAPRHRRFLDALGVAVYTSDPEGRITYYNDAAADLWGRQPEIGEQWCGSWRLFWSDGTPMRHDECPMAVALNERHSVRGHEAIAERPDGSRVSFVPYPTPLLDEAGEMIGAVNVLVDVTERRRAEDALRAAADALAASSSVKDDFLGLVSHELRTPVTTIFGNASLLRDRGARLAAEDRAQMIGDIAEDAERLLGIVENLLLLTRVGSGAQAELEPQVVNHVVRRAVRSYRTRHPERRILLRTVTQQLIVEADAGYLETLLENMVSNADKYSPAGSLVEVRVAQRGGDVEISVRDRGIGISDEDVSKLFTPFYRGEAARQSGNGVGIGLAVCRRLVEMLGGEMTARPRSGGGSEFFFTLPLAGVSD